MEGVKYVKYIMKSTYILPSIQLKCGIFFYKIVAEANGKCIPTMMVIVLDGYEVKQPQLSM